MTPIIASVLAGLIVTAGLAAQDQKRRVKQRVAIRVRSRGNDGRAA